MIRKRLGTGLALLLMCGGVPALACTNFIAGKKATADGSVMVTYAADSHNLYGMLHHAKGVNTLRAPCVRWWNGTPASR